MRIRRDINNNYWAITDKDGIEYVFGVGGVTQSRQYNPGSNETRTFRWHLERVVYPHGTRWDVHYVRDAIDGDHYPKQIMYTGGVGGCSPPGNLSTCRTVEFDYETRTDRIVSYRTGARIVNDQRLRKIDVKMAGVLVRRYALAYTMSTPTNRAYASASQLSSISEIGADGTLSLGPTQFSYNVDANGSSLGFAGITMTGDPPEGLGDPAPLSNPPTASDCAFNVDVNGDLLPDILVGQDSANGGYYFYPNQGANNYGAKTTVPSPTTSLPSLCQVRSEWRKLSPLTRFLNKFDFIMINVGTDGPSVDAAGGSSSRGGSEIETVFPVTNTGLVDLNGDNLIDILYSPNVGQWYWWRNTGSGRFADRASIGAGPSTIQLNDPYVRLGDMDSDGLIDIVRMVKLSPNNSSFCLAPFRETWSLEWWRNMGNQTGTLQFQTSARTFNSFSVDLSYPDASKMPWVCESKALNLSTSPNIFSLADMSGDGLLDIVWLAETAQENVVVAHHYPNQGASFGARVTQTHYSGGGVALPKGVTAHVNPTEYERVFGDINADGLPDIFVGAGGNYHFYPLRADGKYGDAVVLGNSPSFDLTRENQISLSDTNGDGFPDILRGLPGNYNYWTLDRGFAHRLLDYVRAPFGGDFEFDRYARMRSGGVVKWVLDTLLLDDGAGNSAITNYAYTGGLYAPWPHREFRGYRQVTVTDPPDHANNRHKTIYTFHQDHARKGMINSVEARENTNALFFKETNAYTATTTNGVSRVDLTGVRTEFYNYSLTSDFNQINYARFDVYGNPTLVTLSGTGVATRSTTTEFAYNIADYIVNRPAHTTTRLGSDATGMKMTEEWYDYDGLSNAVAPTKGDLTRETRWLPGGTNPVRQHRYDTFGNRIGTIDPNNNVCEFTTYTDHVVYDTRFQTYPVTRTNAQCQTTSLAYWGVNSAANAGVVIGAYGVPAELASWADENRVRTDLYWDALSRPKAVVIPPDSSDAPTARWDYTVAPNSVHEQRRISPASGFTHRYTYLDMYGRISQVKKPSESPNYWITQDTWYTLRGDVQHESIPYVTSTASATPRDRARPSSTIYYDAVRRPIQVTHADGTYETTSFQQSTVTTVDANTNTTVRYFDGIGRLVRVDEPAGGGTTRYAYDSYGLNGYYTHTITDDANNSYSVTRDALGRVTRQSDPDLGVRQYTYDGNDNILTQTDAKNQTLRFAYDKLDRLATKTYPDNSRITWHYDDTRLGTYRLGRAWQITDLSGSTTFSYDHRGRPTKIDKVVNESSFSTQYTYDSLDRVVNMNYPDGEVVQHTYNIQGMLEKLRSTTYASDYITNLNYNQAYQPIVKAVGNGLFTAYGYNPNNFRLTNLVTNDLQDQTYAYDGAGNITNIYDFLHSGTQSFGYDRLHRLTSASSSASPSYSHAYTYSSIGNLESAANRVFSYPASGAGVAHPHAPAGDGVYQYTYDANGNLQTRRAGGSTRTYYWDYDNRLAKIDSGTAGTYTYDYAGQRVVKREGLSSVVLTPFAHYRTLDGVKRKYYFANGERVAERDGTNAVFYYHPDHLGSTSAVSNSAGTRVKSALFYPYGALRSQSGTKPIAHQYTGQELDNNSGLYHYGARYYDANYLLHFLSPDPVEPNAAYPQTLNRYAYVGNNPVNYIDPTGEVKIPGSGKAKAALSSAATSLMLKALRQRAVRDAWKMERRLVEITNQGTRDWTPAEIQELLKTGEIKGYQGHHIKSVNKYPQYAGDQRNIEFVTENEHLINRHRNNFKNDTDGEFIDRTLGGTLPPITLRGGRNIYDFGAAVLTGTVGIIEVMEKIDPLYVGEAGRGSDIIPNVMREHEPDWRLPDQPYDRILRNEENNRGGGFLEILP